MDSLDITVTFCVKTSEEFRVYRYFILPYYFWKLALLLNDLADSIGANFKCNRSRPQMSPLKTGNTEG